MNVDIGQFIQAEIRFKQRLNGSELTDSHFERERVFEELGLTERRKRFIGDDDIGDLITYDERLQVFIRIDHFHPADITADLIPVIIQEPFQFKFIFIMGPDRFFQEDAQFSGAIDQKPFLFT